MMRPDELPAAALHLTHHAPTPACVRAAATTACYFPRAATGRAKPGRSRAALSRPAGVPSPTRPAPRWPAGGASGGLGVVRREENSFRLATLDDHLEDEIEFRAEPDGHTLHFEIESWASAGDRLSALLYSKLRPAKKIQLNMGSHLCVRAAELAGGRPQGGVTIRTRWVPRL